MRVSKPFHYPSDEGITLSDLFVTVHAEDEASTPLDAPDLALDPLSEIGPDWYRFTGIPGGYRPVTLTAVLDGGPSEVVFQQTWESRVEEAQVLALFQSPGSGGRVTYTFSANTVGVAGIQVSVWTADLALPVIPRLTTDTSGKTSFWLPAGSYKVFAYKPFVTFPAQPFALTVAEAADLTPSVEVVLTAPALPTQPNPAVSGGMGRQSSEHHSPTSGGPGLRKPGPSDLVGAEEVLCIGAVVEGPEDPVYVVSRSRRDPDEPSAVWHPVQARCDATAAGHRQGPSIRTAISAS